MTSKKRDLKSIKPVSAAVSPPLLEDLRRMIEETRQGVAVTVNAALTMLSWRVGKRINEEILKGERAEYGQQILATLSQELVRDYGNGFSYSILTRMLKFSDVFPDQKIVVTLSQTLSWSHFRELLPLERPLQRDFYAEMCRIESGSVRTLRQKIGSMLYERTAPYKKPEELASIELDALRDEDQLTPDMVFRDHYSIFSDLPGHFRKKTWKPPFSAKWKHLSWNLALDLPLPPGKNGLRWMVTTFTALFTLLTHKNLF